MDTGVIDDLKQFIAATVSQTVSQEVGGLRQEMYSGFAKITTRIDDLSAAVADAIDTNNEILGKQLKNHDQRITRLERRTARQP